MISELLEPSTSFKYELQFRSNLLPLSISSAAFPASGDNSRTSRSVNRFMGATYLPVNNRVGPVQAIVKQDYNYIKVKGSKVKGSDPFTES
jgi:hypothetical protein